jgi:hypothetical protein
MIMRLTICVFIVFWSSISSAGYLGIGEQHYPPPKQELSPIDLKPSIPSLPATPEVKEQNGVNKSQSEKFEPLDREEKARIERGLKDEDDQIEKEIEKEVPPEPENPLLLPSGTTPISEGTSALEPSRLPWFVTTLLVLAGAIAGLASFGYFGHKLDDWLRRKGWEGGEDVILGLFGLLGLAVGAFFIMWLLRWE